MPLLTTALVWLTTFRLTRLVVADSFPPAAAFRKAVADRFGKGSSWAYLVNCPWCSGVWVAGAVVGAVTVADRWGWAHAPLPLPAFQLVAAAAAAGLIAAVAGLVDAGTTLLSFMVNGPAEDSE